MLRFEPQVKKLINHNQHSGPQSEQKQKQLKNRTNTISNMLA